MCFKAFMVLLIPVAISQVLLDPAIACHSQICFGQKAVTTILKVLRLKDFLNGLITMLP